MKSSQSEVCVTDVPILQIVRTGGTQDSEAQLRSLSSAADLSDTVLNALVEDLLNVMHSYPICVGLAAVQIGVPTRVAVVSVDRSTDPIVLINPEIVSES